MAKRTLSVGYLVGTGGALSAILLSRALFAELDGVTTAGTVTGLALSFALVYAGVWLVESDLDGDRVWRVTKWGGAGIAALTVVDLLVVLGGSGPPRAPGGSFLLLSHVAAGGVVGVLVGGIRQLEEDRDTVVTLKERNDVLNRVLRHNVRNDMNVVLGYAEEVGRELPEDDESIERIRERADDLLR